MVTCDNTQLVLKCFLKNTEATFSKLLSSYGGSGLIKTCLDLGFPHDVIRIAGGFATGAYVAWETSCPIIPVDTCVNVCSCSILEIDNDIVDIINATTFDSLNQRLQNGIYVSNFHRGNHFISYLKSNLTDKRYLLLHSSASEFKNNFNGLYPVRGNWFFDQIKVFTNGNSYIRYIEGKDAELFYKLAQGLISFNENRHEFVAQLILRGVASIEKVEHHHHYFMPGPNSVVMGSHIIPKNAIAPVLTLPGADIYMVQFSETKDPSLYVGQENFLIPHGWGKRHKNTPTINIDFSSNKFTLDEKHYNIEFGESLRAHPNLEIRDFQTATLGRKENFFAHLKKTYEYILIDELSQIASYNKSGIVIW